jgi:hypothetical protein
MFLQNKKCPVFLSFCLFCGLFTSPKSAIAESKYQAFDLASSAFAREYCLARDYGAGAVDAGKSAMAEAVETFELFASGTSGFTEMLLSHFPVIERKVAETCGRNLKAETLDAK